MKMIGSRLEVWLGKAIKTKWGLTKERFKLNDRGRLVSRTKSDASRHLGSIKRLAGWMGHLQEAREAMRTNGADLQGVLVNHGEVGQELYQRACKFRDTN